MPNARLLSAAVVFVAAPLFWSAGFASPFAAASATAPVAPTAAPSVGVVDLLAVRDVYPRWVRLRAELDEKRRGYNTQMQRLEKDKDELKATLELFDDPTNPERRLTEFKLEAKIAEQRFFAKQFSEQSDLDMMRALLEVYEDIERGIAKVAETRGVHLVLRKHEPRAEGDLQKLGGAALEQRFARLERQQVWYSAPDIDLTGDVIKLLQVPLDDSTGAVPTSGGKGGGAANGGG